MFKEATDSFVNIGLQKIRVFNYEITDSTNTRAKLFAKNRDAAEKSPAIFLSRAQSAGRGTRGRAFESPEGAGVYISFLFYPELLPKDTGKITAYAAVAVCRALRRAGVEEPRLKWVNDVLVKGRKLAGILTEGAIAEDGSLEYAIVGVGINTARGKHSPEVEAIMTSLCDLGIKKSPEELAYALVEEFFGSIATLGTDYVREEYVSLSMLIGNVVKIYTGEGIFTEKVINIDSELALVTEGSQGEIKRYISGDVSVRLQQ